MAKFVTLKWECKINTQMIHSILNCSGMQYNSFLKSDDPSNVVSLVGFNKKDTHSNIIKAWATTEYKKLMGSEKNCYGFWKEILCHKDGRFGGNFRP